MSEGIKLQCTLSNRELVEKGRTWVKNLARTHGECWALSIPPQVNSDPDFIIDELCNRVEMYQDASVRASKVLANTEAQEIGISEKDNSRVFQCSCCGFRTSEAMLGGKRESVKLRDIAHAPQCPIVAAMKLLKEEEG